MTTTPITTTPSIPNPSHGSDGGARPREAAMATWLPGPLPPDVEQALKRLRGLGDVHKIAVMPDVHLGRDVCNGVVLATRTRIYPAAVGGDIGCGIAALRFNAEAAILSDPYRAALLLGALGRRIPTIRHARGGWPQLPRALAEAPLSAPQLDARKQREGRSQLGTLGRGNHFIEFQADDEGRLWLMVHTGSRAMGQAIRDWHVRSAQQDGSSLPWLDSRTPQGRAYLSDMAWALAWAQANRTRLLEVCAELLTTALNITPEADSLIQCAHNLVSHETHPNDGPLWVHRKGAISAQEGEQGIIPGSMGTVSFHVVGRGEPCSLCSSSHGAGRVLSRRQARDRISTRALHRQMGGVWFDHRVADRLRDEAPEAYKDIRAVMRAQRPLTRVVRELRPVLCFKGI